MKILHCADVHLGSKIESKFPKEKSDERKKEIRAGFNRIVQYAQENDIHVIILAGDVFDSDRPLKKDKEFFYSVVKHNPGIDFLYLRGNHDILESYTEYGVDNLKTFSDEWVSYEYDGVTISGIEIAAGNATALYSSLKLNKRAKNIVVMHGQIGTGSGKDKIQLTKLRNKNIDYLALGHVHLFSTGKIDERGTYVYPGCPEGRGFDECGVKGFVEIDVGDEITYKFVENSYRTIDELTVDISDTSDIYTAVQKVSGAIKCSSKDIVRVTLVGQIKYDADGLAEEIEKQLALKYYYISVKNKATMAIDADKLAGDLSLRGEFIRTVLASQEYSEEEKTAIISCGLRALGGGEVEI